MEWQIQSHRTPDENWMGDGWICVPERLKNAVELHAPYCTLSVENGVLVGITPIEKPVPELAPPTPEEKLRADVDYLAALQGVVL